MMNNDITTYELIQDFLNGKLPQDAIKSFEKRLSEEKGFEKYVQYHQEANLLIRNKELASIKNQIKSIHHNNSGYGIKRFWIGLTVFSLLVVSGFWICIPEFKEDVYNPKSEAGITSKEDVVESVIIHSEPESTLIGISDNNESLGNEKNESFERIHNNDIETNGNANMVDVSLSEMIKKETPNQLRLSTEKPDVLIPNEELPGVSVKKADSGNVDCFSYAVALDLNIIPSCSSKNNGAINILNQELPQNYSFIIDDNNAQLKPEFTALAIGTYNLYLLDENRCKSDPTIVEIGERNCNIIISHSQGILWDIPIEFTLDKNVLLEVYHAKSGRFVYSKILDSNRVNVWNGFDSNNQYLPMGLYIYKIMYRGAQYSGEINILN